MRMAIFLEDLRELLQRDAPLTGDMLLKDVEEWDSLAMMACMAWFDKKFGLKTTIAQYKKLRAVQEIAALAGGAVA